MSRIDNLLRDLCPAGVPFRALGEIGTVSRGKRFVKADMLDSGVPCMHYGEIYTRYGVAASRSHSFVSEDRAKTLRFAYPGDVIMASAGETVEDIGKSVAWLGDDPIVIHDACYSFSSPLDPKYVSYYFASRVFREQIRQHISSSKISSISTQNISKAQIPVPPLEVQREIVRMLDPFTQLEAELEAELKAELEARRRQYEHYLRSVVLPDAAVEWTSLGEATLNHDRWRRPVTRAHRQGGEFPYYGANGVQDYVHDFLFDGTYLLVGEDGSVKNADGTPVLNWASGKIWVNNHAHVLTAADERFSLRYLYFYLATVDVTSYVTGGTQPKINQKNLNKIPVPLIPRDYQDEVVAVLDRFDSLVNDLSICLPAELYARRKQYEYYRDKLMTFTGAAA